MKAISKRMINVAAFNITPLLIIKTLAKYSHNLIELPLPQHAN